MRYQVRWTNHYWKTFDTHAYTDAAIHMTRAEAEANVARLNSQRRA